MSEEPVDLTQELLRQIRAELAAFRSDTERRFELVARRFDGLESDLLEVKRALRGLTYMSAPLNGRIEDVETRVDRLMPRST